MTYDIVDRLPPRQGNFEALPKWAQRHIENLERIIGEWRVKAQDGPPDSNTVLRPHTHGKPLGRDATVRFYLGDDHDTAYWIDVRVERDLIDVQCSDMLQVHPVALNHVELSPGGGAR